MDSGREWREGKGQQIGFAELEDIAKVRAAVIEQGLVDASRCILTGESWGGFTTLLGMGIQKTAVTLWDIRNQAAMHHL